jgi:drug/metabolite transporter (DMT)-like permease
MPNATDSSLLSTERRASLIIGLTIAVALDTAVQICWKVGAADIDDDIPLWASGNAVFEAPLFLLIGALMACQLFNWLKVLSIADLSFARPFTALSSLTVSVISALTLGERLTLLQGIGIAVIMAGVWCVSCTDTTPPEAP